MPFDFDMDSMSPVNTGGGGGSVNVSPLNITPTTSAQSFVPAAGNAYAPVNVSGVNASIDSNITAGNIVNGVNILGVVGVASASAPKEIARYKIYDNGVTEPSDRDLTGAFNDVVYVADNGMRQSFAYSEITGDASFPNCTNVGNYAFASGFQYSNISSLSFPNLTKLNAVAPFQYVGYYCPNLYNISFPNLVNAGHSAFSTSFNAAGWYDETRPILIDFSKLETIGNYAFNSAFSGAEYYQTIQIGSLGDVNFPKLENCGSSSFLDAFAQRNISSVSMPNISNLGSSAFKNSFKASNITGSIHIGTSAITDTQAAFTWAFRYSIFNSANFGFTSINRCNQFFDTTFASSTINRVSFDELTYVNAQYTFNSTFNNSTVKYVDFPKLETIGGLYCFYHTFAYTTNLISANFNSLWWISADTAFTNTFLNSAIENFGMPNMVILPQGGVFGATFRSSNITTASFENLIISIGKFPSSFVNCSNFSNFYAPNLMALTTSGGNTFYSTFYNCTNLTTFSLPSLCRCGGQMFNAFAGAFNGSGIKDIYFNALHSASFGVQNRSFTNMLMGVNGCNVHFPSNLESTIQNWAEVTGGFGGTNTTVLFDLSPSYPVSETLTENGTIGGANFAVTASSDTDNAYKVLDSNASSSWYPTSNNADFILYYPTPAKLYLINDGAATETGYMVATISNVYGSNDNSTWVELERYSSSTNTQAYIGNPDFYKYYKINFTSMEEYLPKVTSLSLYGFHK